MSSTLASSSFVEDVEEVSVEAQEDKQSNAGAEVGASVHKVEQLAPGITKQVLELGRGWKKPCVGLEVCFEYEASTLDGVVFESSKERGEVRFDLGDETMVPGMNTALASMRLDEMARFTFAPEQAYGDEGLGDDVGPGESVHFVVKLTGFEFEQTVTADGAVTRRTIEPGKPKTQAGAFATLLIEVVGAADGTVFLEESELVVELGEGQVVPGLESALQYLENGERSLIRVEADHGYLGTGIDAPEGVDLRATLEFDVRVLDIYHAVRPYECKDAQEKLEEAEHVRQAGNGLYKRGKWELALARYQQCLDFLHGHKRETTHEAAMDMRLKVLLNMTACMVQRKEWEDAQEWATKALLLDRTSVKALYRRARANFELEEYEKAQQDLRELLLQDSDNSDARKLLYRVEQAIAAAAEDLGGEDLLSALE